MKQLKNDMQAVAKDLKRLIQKTEKMIKQLEKLDKAQHVVSLLIPGLVLPDFFYCPLHGSHREGV